MKKINLLYSVSANSSAIYHDLYTIMLNETLAYKVVVCGFWEVAKKCFFPKSAPQSLAPLRSFLRPWLLHMVEVKQAVIATSWLF
jgi:hypothetical protein